MKAFTLGVFLYLGFALAGSYLVQPGDTLWRISVKYDVDLSVLLLLNPGAADGLRAGTTLLLPERYRVKEGETLWRIAWRYNTYVATLMQLNHLESDYVPPGVEIWVPPAPERPQPVAVALSGSDPPKIGAIERVATSYLGAAYRWGGSGPEAFDCSGYVNRVFGELGYNLPRSTRDLWVRLQPVSVPGPGDLVFFSFGGHGVDHVGIYLGDDRFIHANSLTGRVMIERFDVPWYRKVYLGARRVTPASQTSRK